MNWIPIALAVAAGAYQILALVASLYRRRLPPGSPAFIPRVSILKPVRGVDTGFYEAIRSNVAQDYPDFEILFGISDPTDPAIPVIARIAREFPDRLIRTLLVDSKTPNRKAGTVVELAKQATGQVIIISDADIRVPDGYLRAVVAPLANPAVGLVTCAYGARAEHPPARFEALGVAADFGPSTMVAPFVGVDGFGLGSTLAVRTEVLARIGGFESVVTYLADDYQIGRRIHALGLHCVLSDVVVETHLAAETWREVWNHQVRWARTIRVSRGPGYAGLFITYPSVWAAFAALAGYSHLAIGLMVVRYSMAMGAGWIVFGSSDVIRLWWALPIHDFFGMAVWVTGLWGDTVEWGGRVLRITGDGKIVT